MKRFLGLSLALTLVLPAFLQAQSQAPTAPGYVNTHPADCPSGGRADVFAFEGDHPIAAVPENGIVSVHLTEYKRGFYWIEGNDVDGAGISGYVYKGCVTMGAPPAAGAEIARAAVKGEATGKTDSHAISASVGSASSGTQSPCQKNISFAVAYPGQIVTGVPAFAAKWITKNQKKYPGVCFSQTPIQNANNFLLVLASSTSVFSGLYPTVRNSTSTSASPVYGSGTLTDNYGGMWYYAYNGTVTTTTTTTQYVDVPYTDTSNTLYLYCYDQRGTLCGQHWRTLTSRSGGDPYNTLGYNLGSLLVSIHVRERLLKDAVHDIAQR